MKKLFSRLPRLKKGQRIIRNLIVVLLLGLYLYVAAGFPVMSEEQAFRRLEKRWLVGPAEILTVLDCASGHEKVVAAAYEGDILLGMLNEAFIGLKGWDMTFLEKTDGIVLTPVPRELGLEGEAGRTALLLFDDFPQAVRCEVSVHMQETWMVNGSGPYDFDREYTLSADRGMDGLFLLELESQFENQGSWKLIEREMFERLREIPQGLSSYGFSADVKLYDDAGGLVTEIETVFDRNMVK